jgi:hypothetical protein
MYPMPMTEPINACSAKLPVPGSTYPIRNLMVHLLVFQFTYYRVSNIALKIS